MRPLLMLVAGLLISTGTLHADDVAGNPPLAALGPGDRPPKARVQAPPEYPFSLRLSGKKGEVIVQFVVDPKGNVLNAQVVKASHPDFEAPAVEAVLKWKFEPALKDGQPVFVKMQVPILFALRDYAVGTEHEGGMDVWRVPPHPPKGAPAEFDYDQPPQPQLTNAPVYPFDQVTRQAKGKATVAFAVDPKGRTHILKLVDASQPEFGAAACAMIMSWEFSPAQKAGKPCWAVLEKKVGFSLNDDEFPLNDSARRLLKELKKDPCPILVSTATLDHPLVGRFQPSPVVPDAVIAAGVPAKATIGFVIDHAGHAQLPRVLSATTDDFGWAAATAVARWQFTAPTVAGHPVDVRANIPVIWNPPARSQRSG